MATNYKIHPAIGIARVGNSPDEFFIGPERAGEHPDPPGGFKDAQCRVKRQAARFRIFAHHDDGTSEEITDAEAEITWTVHLVNKKATNPGRGNTESLGDLTIDPGSRTLDGPDQRELLDNGMITFSGAPARAVSLGEARTDNKGRLVVLGGHGLSESPTGAGLTDFWANDDWYDDVSDGSISATIKIRATNATPQVIGAWVVVAPPKFAPHIDNIITLHDRLLQAMVDGGLLPAPTTTSYTKDVRPVLQRARDTAWVHEVSALKHAWPDPVPAADRDQIFKRLRAPLGVSPPPGAIPSMPPLQEQTGDGRLTPVQYQHMKRWRDGLAADDWVGPPPPEPTVTPGGLDRAALEHCVGGAFYPGIEVGGKSDPERLILDTTKYLEPFRLDHSKVVPGDLSYSMALPWQADFKDCADLWWPVPRPNRVRAQAGGGYVEWARGVTTKEEMAENWHTLGFVVKQGNEQVEVGRCDVPSITLLTPHLHFRDVEMGTMGMVREMPLAITFEVVSPAAAVTLEIPPAGMPTIPQLEVANASAVAGPTAPNEIVTLRLWVVLRADSVGTIPQQQITVKEVSGSGQWTITVTGNVVSRTTTAVALVLDRSGSMADDSGDGTPKHVVLRHAAQQFVDLMLDGDGVGIVSYNGDAIQVQPVLALADGGSGDAGRNDTIAVIGGSGLDPQGWTSIGDGIFEGRELLNAPGASGYGTSALVVLTDGVENHPRTIADVAPEIDERTYAIGFGTPQNTSAPALQAIAGNHGGYLLVTGNIDPDEHNVLEKCFLQILAGVSNAEVVLDPSGVLVPGAVHRIPFSVTRRDAGLDVILLTPSTKIVDFRIETPSGRIIEPWIATQEPWMRFSLSGGMSYYRIVLPSEFAQGRFDHGGTWNAVVALGAPRLSEPPIATSSRAARASGLRDFGSADMRIAERLDFTRRMAHAPVAPRAVHEGVGYLATHAGSYGAAGDATSHDVASHDATGPRANRGPFVPYSIVVHAYSSVALRVDAEQRSFEPGAKVRLLASLTESGIPLTADVHVWADVSTPDGRTTRVDFTGSTGGRFSAELEAEVPGVHRARVRACGQTRHGERFTRERLVTVPVWRGGDRPVLLNPVVESESRAGDRSYWCDLLECLLARGGLVSPDLEKRLAAGGVDIERLRACISKACDKRDLEVRGHANGGR